MDTVSARQLREQDEQIHGDSIRTSGEAVYGYSRLHSLYADSDYGHHQAAQTLRYAQQYSYDRDVMLQDLGDDIHPVRHMTFTESQILRPLLTAQNTSRDLEYQYITADQIIALRAGTLLHDIGECEHPAIAEKVGGVVGDVFYETKNVNDSEQEALVRAFLYTELFNEVPEEILELAEDVSNGSQTEFIEEAFNTVERIGYYQTAIRAGRVALESLEREPAVTHRVLMLGRLAYRVSRNHRGILEERSRQFPYAGSVLVEHSSSQQQIDSDFSRFAELSVNES